MNVSQSKVEDTNNHRKSNHQVAMCSHKTIIQVNNAILFIRCDENTALLAQIISQVHVRSIRYMGEMFETKRAKNLQIDMMNINEVVV